MVPVIETERLRLRSYRIEDLAAQAAMLSDPNVMRYIGGSPLNREQAWRKMLSIPGLWSLLGYGYWAVERREDGTFIGQVGFSDFKRDITPSIEGIPEMGWLFLSTAQGLGYAAEAVGAALGWADQALSGQEFVAVIAPDNIRSLRLARKMGFVREVSALYGDEQILLLFREALAG